MKRRGRRKPAKDVTRYPGGKKSNPAAPFERSGVEARRLVIMGYDPARFPDKRITSVERDMRLSTPLGLMSARGLVTKSQYDAGEEFYRRWEAAGWPKHPHSCFQERVGRGGPEAGPSAHAEDLYRQAHDALVAIDSPIYRTVVNLVLHQHYPRLLDIQRRRTPDGWKADQRTLDSIHTGLNALAKEFGFSRAHDERPFEIEVSVTAFLIRQTQPSKS